MNDRSMGQPRTKSDFTSLTAGSTIAAFVADMIVVTARGPVAAGDLVPGDLLFTRDSGFVPLVFAAPLLGVHAMVRVSADRLGPGMPAADMTVPAGLGLWNLRDETALRPVSAVRLCSTLGESAPGAQRVAPRAMVALLCDRAVGLLSGGAWVECPAPTARLVAQMLPLLDDPAREALVAAFSDRGIPAAAAEITPDLPTCLPRARLH